MYTKYKWNSAVHHNFSCAVIIVRDYGDDTKNHPMEIIAERFLKK